MVNERDELGSDLVPDYMTAVKDGGFYGWPYSYYGQHVDERVKPQRPELVAKAIVPDYALGPHTASLGLTFAQGAAAMPPAFRQGAFVGQHGSWNRKPHSGYKVIFVPFENGRPAGSPARRADRFSRSGRQRPRPAGRRRDRPDGGAAGRRRRRQPDLARHVSGPEPDGQPIGFASAARDAIVTDIARTRGTSWPAPPSIAYAYLDSPVGCLLLAGDADGLMLISFPCGRRPREPSACWTRDDRVLAEPIAQLRSYFAGELREFSLPLRAQGTPFQNRVWSALQAVPFGATTSYGELARRIGQPSAARAVGAANGANPLPIVVPCHRVIGGDHSLTGFGGGLATKRLLLAHEARYSRHLALQGELFG